jgi:hypothetical protein
MSRRIAYLLDEPEHIVTKRISQLEAKNGYPSHDARLLAENIQKIRIKVANLGLDADDTTGRELYHALLAKFNRDCDRFEDYYRMVGAGFDEKISKAASLITQSTKLPERWSIKSPSIKNLLRQQPPKRLMKQLKYRSVDSLIKRENPAEVLMMAQILESAAWQKSFDRLVSRLPQSAIEMHPLKIVPLKYSSWSGLKAPDEFVITNDHMASIGLYPFKALIKAPFLNIVLLLLEGVGARHVTGADNPLAKWGNLLDWWLDMDYLMANFDSEPVSLCLKDTALNSLMDNDYELRLVENGKKSFWDELVSRYENLPPVEGLFDHSIKEKVSKLKLAIPEPLFELAEEFDG